LVEGKVEFKFLPRKYGNMSIDYVYNAHQGDITFQPAVYKYQPAFQGMLQTKILTVKSNFSYAFEIVSVKSADPRIDIRLLDKVIKPFNMSISGMITYDAGKTGMEKQSDYIKAISQFSIDNPPTLQIDALNFHKMQAKRGIKPENYNLKKKFESLSDKEILSNLKSLELDSEDGTVESSLVKLNLQGDQSDNGDSISIPMKDAFVGKSVQVSSKKPNTTLNDWLGSKDVSTKQNTGLFASMDKEFKINESINYRDIISWRERQDDWRNLEMQQLAEVHSEIEIETTIMDKIVIPVETTLRKPQITNMKSV
jgi:hypothetical protein